MKSAKMNVYKIEGLAITVDVKGSLEEYAKNFLHIFNNVRDSKSLIKVENHHNNDVTVYCKPEFKDSTIRYLSQFGEIKDCEEVLMYQLEDADSDFDWDKYTEAIVVPYFD